MKPINQNGNIHNELIRHNNGTKNINKDSCQLLIIMKIKVHACVNFNNKPFERYNIFNLF